MAAAVDHMRAFGCIRRGAPRHVGDHAVAHEDGAAALVVSGGIDQASIRKKEGGATISDHAVSLVQSPFGELYSTQATQQPSR